MRRGQPLKPEASRVRVTNGHRALVCGLILAGQSYIEACRIAGVPPRRLRLLLEPDWSARVNRPRRWKADELRDLEEAYRDPKLSVASIAQMFKTHAGNICTMARQQGWPMRLQKFPRGHVATMQPEKRRLYLKLRAVVGRVEAEREALR